MTAALGILLEPGSGIISPPPLLAVEGQRAETSAVKVVSPNKQSLPRMKRDLGPGAEPRLSLMVFTTSLTVIAFTSTESF